MSLLDTLKAKISQTLDEQAKWRQQTNGPGLGKTFVKTVTDYGDRTMKESIGRDGLDADSEPFSKGDMIKDRKLSLSQKGLKLLKKNAQNNLKGAIRTSLGKHGKSNLPEEVELEEGWGNFKVHTSTGVHKVYGPSTDVGEMQKHLGSSSMNQRMYGTPHKVEPDSSPVKSNYDEKSHRSRVESVEHESELEELAMHTSFNTNKDMQPQSDLVTTTKPKPKSIHLVNKTGQKLRSVPLTGNKESDMKAHANLKSLAQQGGHSMSIAENTLSDTIKSLVEAKLVEASPAYETAGVKGSEEGDRFELRKYSTHSTVVKTHQGGKSLKNDSGGYPPIATGGHHYTTRKFNKLQAK